MITVELHLDTVAGGDAKREEFYTWAEALVRVREILRKGYWWKGDNDAYTIYPPHRIAWINVYGTEETR